MSKLIKLFTIGFTKKSAEQFFECLVNAEVKRIIDTRLNNVSQLAGFAKRNDLKYFLKKIGNIEYVHILDLAPTKEILDDYKKKKIDWTTYENSFNQLIAQRNIENKVDSNLLNAGCLLCSEDQPHYCHRRLVAEYFQKNLSNSVKIYHL